MDGFDIKQLPNGKFVATAKGETKEFKTFLEASNWAVAKEYGLPLPNEEG